MRTAREPLRFLAPEEMETLHRNALRLLDRVGMRIDHEEALEALRAAGCRVDFERRQVHFPEAVVEAGVERLRQGLAERGALLGARIQMISEYYGCPSGVHGGKTDACVPDVRCGVEKGISMLLPVLCGAIGFGTVGHLENAVTFSPLQLVMDNEIARYVRRAVSGFEVTDATVNADLIERVGSGGHYLHDQDTVARFREVLNLSPFFAVEPWGCNVRLDDARGWLRQAEIKVRELLAKETEPPLSPDQVQQVDEIVREAEASLRQQGRL